MYKQASGGEMKSKKIGGSGTQKAIMACFLLCCMIIFSAAAVSAASQSVIPDTGQTLCYDGTGAVIACPAADDPLAQDGTYPGNTMNYSASGGVITDGVTTLQWTLDDGFTYNWYEASGIYDATSNPDTINVCSLLGALWRLPTIKELNQIVDYGTSDPAIDSTFLGINYTPGSGYWSATGSGATSANAMNIHFDSDVVSRIDGRDKASEANYVMCVKGSELLPGLAVNGLTGTVSDNNTGLMWQKQDDNVQRTWESALSYCESLTLSGYPDWRLPDIKELQTIVDYASYNPAVDTLIFPGTNSVSYWSSTTDDAYNDSAWTLNFSDGTVVSSGKALGTLYTRCVRDNVVDTTGPDTAIITHPSDPSNSSSATFTFSSEQGATFKCKIDTGTYAACTSPKSYTGLEAISHTFYVKATDAALNVGTPVTFTWTISLDPDLTITALTVPSTGGAGTAISVSDTTKNIGLNPSADSTTSFYLSSDSVLDGADVLLGSRAVGPLTAAATSTAASTSLTIPLGTLDGLYYIIAKADGPDLITETNEANNTKTSATQINIGPELTVTALAATVDMALGTISVTDTTKNNGSGVGEVTTSFYLSTDTVLNLAGGDVALGTRVITALAAGVSDPSAANSFPIPSGKAGTFYVIAKADGPDLITETNEANNTKVSALIKIGGDLTVTALTAEVDMGLGTITITDTTKNGTAGSPVNASTTKFWLSKDTVLTTGTGGDTSLGTRLVPALGNLVSDSSNTATTTFSIPSGKAGTFYVIAKADVLLDNTETNETNNTKVSAVIKIGGDITVSTLTALVDMGLGTITVTDKTQNATTGTAVGSSTTKFWLSKDTVLNTGTSGDTVLGTRAVPSLGNLVSDNSDTATTTFSIPSGMAGAFYVIAKADATGLNAESNEANNTKVSAVIKIGGDLTVSALTVPATGVAGSTISATDTTKNGTTGTKVGASTTSFYLSKNNVWNDTDVLLGSRSVGELAVGGYSTATTSLTIPVGTAAGSYYIIAKADATDLNTESVENNNTKVSAVIKIGGDLTVTTVTVPATAAANQTISVTYSVKNIGTDTVAASTTRFYLSSDNLLTPGANGDVSIGGRATDSLLAGGIFTATTTLTIPAGTAAGSYYIIAMADGPDAVSEVSETNNTKASTVIKIGPDLIISALGGPSTAAAGSTISITDTTKNSGAGRAATSTTGFYLSTNTVWDDTDIPLGSRAVVALAAGTSNASTGTSLTIPAGTAPGIYYIIGMADSAGIVGESKENNNTMARAITIP